MMNYKTAEDVKALLSSSGEHAFIDVRENADYGRGHPFFVSHVPYSILEARIGLYVPCHSTPTILLDGGDGVSEKAAARMEESGYSNIIILKGGVSSWIEAGYALYEGISAPSKSFGEVVEHELGTQSITADELKARMDAGDDNFILLDGRTPEEFNRMTIPGSTSCPNAELSLRYPAMMERPDADIIVNCAGRTRSLIGAETLNTLGLDNKIYALENGTMGWRLAGFDLEHGATRSYPRDMPEDVVALARERAQRLIEDYNLDVIDWETLSEWNQEDDKTTFKFDIRTSEEYEAGHPDGFRHAPGGQLVQATDQWFATRNARIVIFDNHRIRGAMTAIWLRGMGHDAALLDETSVKELQRVSEFEIDISGLDLISAGEIKERQSSSTIIDVRSSQDYRDGHIEGAIWSIRPNIDKLAIDGDIIIVASELLTATYALKDLGGKGAISLTESDDWKEAGLNLVSTPNDPPDGERIDFLFHTHARHSGNMDHAREYLRWETGLMDQMDDQESGTLTPLKP